jgi:cation diffusion facilitator CzcD-associated flavoprotein CzcO
MDAFVLRSDSGGSVTRSTAKHDRRTLRGARSGRPLSVETMVIGAGQAGLAASRELLVLGVDDVALERGVERLGTASGRRSDMTTSLITGAGGLALRSLVSSWPLAIRSGSARATRHAVSRRLTWSAPDSFSST